MQRLSLALLPTLLLFGCGGGDSEPSMKKPATKAPAAAEHAAETAPEAMPEPEAAATGGSMTWDGSQGVSEVMGTIMFSGDAPAIVMMDMSADAKCHDEGIVDPSVLINDGKLQNVFVYVSKAPKGMTYPKGTGSVMLTQKGCMYEPHVLGLQKGQSLSITNGDVVTHNVHSYSKKNKAFNKSQPAGNPALDVSFKRKEDQFAIKCDIHKWMSSYVCVTDYPFYAVSAADGTFNLGKLPAGEYTVTATHEVYGAQTAKVTVSDSGASTLDFTFKAN